MLARTALRSRTGVRAFSSRTPIVGGNWKLNAGKGTTQASVEELVTGLNAAPAAACQTFICPPSLYTASVASTVDTSKYIVSSQNIYSAASGAYTGEVSGEMLMDMGVDWTLVGHSERRDIFGETDELLGAKIAYGQSIGMTVVACCGEQQEEREAGTTMDVLIPQLQAIVDNTSDWDKLVIAYEPVWAIGTGLVATPEQAQDTCADIRTWIAANASAEAADGIRIQYGGSVNDKNASTLAACPDIDGFLVGGACLAAPSFITILQAFDA